MPRHADPRHAVTQPSDPSYRLIPLTQGQNAIVDTEDFVWLSRWNWSVRNAGIEKCYAVRNDKGKSVYMHRVIMNEPDSEIDHRDGDGLNNRRFNLRSCAHGENIRNKKKQKNSRQPYKGVRRVDGRWYAYIGVKRKLCHLGAFDTAAEAAKAYDEAASRHFGEFAHLNFPTA